MARMVRASTTGKERTAEAYLFTEEPKSVPVLRNNLGENKTKEILLAISILLEEKNAKRLAEVAAVFETVAANAARIRTAAVAAAKACPVPTEA